MPDRDQLERIKRATVAIALVPDEPPEDPTQAPFTILGSGFCIDPSGVVVTCEHVVSSFLQQNIRQVIAEVPDEDKGEELWPLRGVRMLTPHALFYAVHPDRGELQVLPVPVAFVSAKLDYDLGLARLRTHAAFRDGYPHIEPEDFANVYEGMDVAACGFPLGNDLHDQFGTKTSSFTRGILSSIAPAPGILAEEVIGFQLDITATHGNSGGPVFAWDSGRVIGFVQGGPTVPQHVATPGLVFAESIFRPLHDGTIERFLNGEPPVVAS